MKLRPHQQRGSVALQMNAFGQVIVPTGGGKTLIMILDALRRFNESATPLTILVCAPRILLAEQLSSEFLEMIGCANVLHVHSGETHHYSTTKPEKIVQWDTLLNDEHKLIFTTYHSLRRINESGIKIDVAYFDEAHNATKKNFFTSVAECNADNYYYFTATPKHTASPYGTGMNNRIVFGDVLETVPAPELVENGSILPPTVLTHEVDYERQKGISASSDDAQTLLNIIDNLDEHSGSKVLVASPSSKVLWEAISRTALLDDLKERGYDVLHITSKFGAYVNRQKVNREQFFDTFNAWGKDPNRKFVIFHYSILSEGINVHGLTHTILMRNLNVVEMAQTIGRVIRLNHQDAQDIATGKIAAGQFNMYRKPTGFVTVPVFKNYGKKTQARLEDLIHTVFVEGKPAIHVTK
jgi:superfamily II DNA or RNA helicase